MSKKIVEELQTTVQKYFNENAEVRNLDVHIEICDEGGCFKTPVSITRYN